MELIWAAIAGASLMLLLVSLSALAGLSLIARATRAKLAEATEERVPLSPNVVLLVRPPTATPTSGNREEWN